MAMRTEMGLVEDAAGNLVRGGEAPRPGAVLALTWELVKASNKALEHRSCALREGSQATVVRRGPEPLESEPAEVAGLRRDLAKASIRDKLEADHEETTENEDA